MTTRGRGGTPLAFPIVHADPKSQSYVAIIQTHASMAMAEAKLEPFKGPVGVRIVAVWPLAKSHWRKSPVPRRRKVGKPDYDNIAKLVGDACNGVVYLDDSQCFAESIEKWTGAQGEAPRVELRFTEYGEDAT